jgi:hypothetical protein
LYSLDLLWFELDLLIRKMALAAKGPRVWLPLGEMRIAALFAKGD